MKAKRRRKVVEERKGTVRVEERSYGFREKKSKGKLS